MAKAKRRVGKGKAKKSRKAAQRKPAAKRKPATAAPRPIVIPGAWPFPMGSKA